MEKKVNVNVELLAPINPEKELNLHVTDNCSLIDIVKTICCEETTYANQLLDDDDISPYIRIGYNGRIVDSEEYENVMVKEGDNIVLISSVRGG